MAHCVCPSRIADSYYFPITIFPFSHARCAATTFAKPPAIGHIMDSSKLRKKIMMSIPSVLFFRLLI
jgi:hypothetical protein